MARRSVPIRLKKKLARPDSIAVNIPPALGGKNSRDNISIMPESDAIDLINWVPTSRGLRSRAGSAMIEDGFSSTLETLIPYNNGAAVRFVAASGDDVYTVLGGTLTSIGSGFSNARWRGDKIGANLMIANGADAPQVYDGSTLAAISFSGDITTYGEEKIHSFKKHKNRVYAWDIDYPNFFYGGVNSVSGAFDEFALENVSDTGGNILEVKTISRDAGDGMDDYIAFILNTGEIIIYKGSDPSDATDWALVGKYVAPPLVAIGCAKEFAGDVMMLTQSDIIKMSDVIKYGSEVGGFNIQPSKMAGDITSDYQAYGTNYGWSLEVYPSGGWIIVNVPEATNSAYHQYVVDTTTGAYTEFQGWNAQCFGVLNRKLYFGQSNELIQGDTGEDDQGAGIQLVSRQAFSNLGTTRKKKISNARLYMESIGTLNIDFSLGLDFDFPNPQGTQVSSVTGAEWDVAAWDTAEWSGDDARTVSFVTAGVGVFVSPQVSMTVKGQRVTWHQTTYNFNAAESY
jgi:hypothetical protein